MKALDNFDPKNTAVIDKRYKNTVGNWQWAVDSSANIKLDSYSPNKLVYSSATSAPQLAVFSEIYYNEEKGWHAYLDGNAVPHFRCNYVLRGMVLPAGTHKIEFKFEPKSVVLGNKIAYAGSFVLFAFVLSALGFAAKQKLEEIETEPKPQPKVTTAPNKAKKK